MTQTLKQEFQPTHPHMVWSRCLNNSKDKTWQPVAYHSRSLSPCEQRYAQIEKEAPAITWVCERHNSYILGKPFEIQTDHKPLIYLFSSKKDLDCLPPRIQRFRMRLMKYSFSIVHVPGKNLNCADTLSKAPKNEPKPDYIFEEEGKQPSLSRPTSK